MIEKEIRNSVQMVVVLAVVGIVSGILLAGIYKYAQPKIELHRDQKKQKAIYSVLGEAAKIRIIKYKGGKIYQGLNRKGEVIGYAFDVKGGGYQGQIILMVGLSPDLSRVLAIEIVDDLETPGLGAEIEEEDFKAQFRDLSISKIDNEVEAIAGATISSKSVIGIVKKGIAEAKDALEKVN